MNLLFLSYVNPDVVVIVISMIVTMHVLHAVEMPVAVIVAVAIAMIVRLRGHRLVRNGESFIAIRLELLQPIRKIS